jgi:hypothetical protein
MLRRKPFVPGEVRLKRTFRAADQQPWGGIARV